MKSRKSYCTTPGISVGGGGISKKFNVKVFYVMGKALQASYPVPVTGLVCLYDRLRPVRQAILYADRSFHAMCLMLGIKAFVVLAFRIITT